MASQQHQAFPNSRPVSYSQFQQQQQQQQQRQPPPVPKKPSIRDRPPHPQEANGFDQPPPPHQHHHQNPQRLKNSALRDENPNGIPSMTSPWLNKQLHQDSGAADSADNYASQAARRAHQPLEAELDDLKAENRAQSRELDTNRYIEREMNRKLKIADDAYMLRHLIKDKERQINNQEKIITDLTEDNARLGEDIADKERMIFQLQSEVDNLDRVIMAKNALKEAERLQAVSEELDRTKDELASIELEVDGAKSELKSLQNQLTRKDREVRTKTEQIENLSRELADTKSSLASLENEKAVSDNHHRTAERENKALKEQVDKLADYRERCRNLEEENAYISEAVRALEAKVFHLETLKRDKETLEELVHDLKTALKDKNKILKDRRDLLIETQQLKDVLREKSTDEEGLHRELGKLKDVLNELERENDFYRDLETDFHKIKKRYEDLERDKFKNELLVAKLRPKVERLQKRCKEKDDLIRRLANELRGGGERLPRELLQEADQNQRKTLDDYVDPADYLVNPEETPLSEQIVARSQGRPKSSDRGPLSPLLQLEQPPMQQQQPQKQPYYSSAYDDPPASPKAAYEPRASAQYQQQQQQSQKPESDYPTYAKGGYLSNQHPYEDRDHRDPHQHQQPEDSMRPLYHSQSQQQPTRDDANDYPVRRASQQQQQQQQQQQYFPPEDRYTSPYSPAAAAHAAQPEPARQRSRSPPQARPIASRTSRSDLESTRSRPPTRLLDSPMNVRINRVLGDGSIMLEWEAPPLDALDRNQGVVVAGYRVFVNGVEEQTVVSCRLTKSLIPKTSLGALASLGVQTFGYDGETSEKIEIPAGEAARGRSPGRDDTPIGRPNSRPVSPYRSPPSPQFQSQSALPPPPPSHSQPQQHGTRRRAARDYRPSDESPSAFPSYELELRRGDDVVTFGPMRPDGMYNAEVNGHRGLVPGQLLELD